MISAMKLIFKGELTEEEYEEAYDFLGETMIISGLITFLLIIF